MIKSLKAPKDQKKERGVTLLVTTKKTKPCDALFKSMTDLTDHLTDQEKKISVESKGFRAIKVTFDEDDETSVKSVLEELSKVNNNNEIDKLVMSFRVGGVLQDVGISSFDQLINHFSPKKE